MIWNDILLPFLFGLLGFLEPCSLGINTIFIARLQSLNRFKRIVETTIFTCTRAFVLSILGLSVAFVGQKIFVFQTFYFVILGIFYALMGVAYIYTKHKGISIPSLNLSRLAKDKNILTLGIVFGLVIPACAIPLLIVLLGQSLFIGDLFKGFVSLFIFGTGLSVPLLLISFSENSIKILKWLSEKANKTPYIAGGLLIIIGITTLLSSYWWIKTM